MVWLDEKNSAFKDNGLPGTREKLLKYLEMVREAGRKINLVSRGDLEFLEQRHLTPSLAVLPLIAEEVKKVLDLGSGAGFPGLPVAIMRGDIEFTLLEATQKKVRFLEKVINELELKNVSECWGRAENIEKGEFDLIMARGVAPMNKLQPLTAPLLKAEGSLIAWKGSRFLDEMKKIKRELFKIEKVIEYDSPMKIIVLKKL